VTLASLEPTAGLEPEVHAYWSSRAPWADWRGKELQPVDPPDHTEESG
jgi:hypothetical protein